ncbi:MAG TPA: 3-keto-5-aminohexanoate cleavage protein [Candidatus Limnocylindria bacterium]
MERGVDTRIGLEDTFFLADRTPAGGNEVLVRAAAAMVRAPRD